MPSSRTNPLRVSCPGCSGKLVVRGENLLGRTVACPRCKHPVAIPSAAQLAAADASSEPPVDSQALTAVDLNAGEPYDVAALGPGGFELPRNFEHLASNFDADNFSRLADAEPDLTRQPPLEVPAAEQWSPADADAWPGLAEPQGGRAIRRLVFLAACVFILSATALALFLQSVRRESTQVAANPVAAAEPATDDDSAPKPPPPAEPIPPAETIASAEPIPSAEPAPASDTAALDATDLPASEPPDVSDPPNVSEPSDGSEPLDASASSDGSAPPGPAADPLMEFLRGSSPELRLSGAPDKAPPPVGPIDREIPDAMRQFAPIFDLGSAAPLPDAPPLDPDAAAAEAHHPKVDLGSLYHPNPQPWPVWDDLRNRSVQRVAVPARPLLTTLYTFEAVFNMPLAWDLEALRFAELDLRQSVAFELRNATLEQLLAECIAAAGLAIKPPTSGSPLPRIVSTESDEIATMLREIDVARWGAAADAAAWSSFFRSLLPGEEAQWPVEESRLILPESMTLADRRMLADALSQLDELFAAGPEVASSSALQRYAAADEGLKKLGSEYAALRRPVAVVLQQSATEAGLDLLVDWNAAWSHGLTPTSSMAAMTAGRSFPQVSRFVLDEFLLVTIVDARGRLVVTDAATQRRLPRILVVPLEQGQTAADLRSQLATLSPMGEDQRSTIRAVAVPGLATWAAVYLCPPSVQQLQDSRVRRGLRLSE